MSEQVIFIFMEQYGTWESLYSKTLAGPEIIVSSVMVDRVVQANPEFLFIDSKPNGIRNHGVQVRGKDAVIINGFLQGGSKWNILAAFKTFKHGHGNSWLE